MCYTYGLGISEPFKDGMRAAGTVWFAGLMCIILVLFVALAAVTTVRCRLGAIYPGELNKGLPVCSLVI